MAFGDLYTTGLVSTDADPTLIIGNGTLWSGTVVAGDRFECGGYVVTIVDVVDNETIQLAYDWPGGPLSDDAYVIAMDAASRTTQATIADSLLATVDRYSTLFSNAVPNYAIVEYAVASPPGGAATGDKYVVATGATGDFSGHENEIAEKTANGWAFLAPEYGWLIVSETDGAANNMARIWDGDSWNEAGGLAAAPNYRGIWESGTDYFVGDVVAHIETLYIASQDTTGDDPASASDYWDVLSRVGEDGGGVTLSYTFKTSTTESVADTDGQINADAALGSSPTVLRLNKKDSYGTDWSTLLASLNSASTSEVQGKLRLIEVGHPENQFVADVTAVALSTDHYNFTIDNTVAVGTIADADHVLFTFTPKGDAGDAGAAGSTGSRGAVGGALTITYDIDLDSVAEGDPGTGILNFNHATQTSATAIRLSDSNNAASSVVTQLGRIDDGTNESPIAYGSIVDAQTPETKWLNFAITAVEDLVGYFKLTISTVAGSSSNPFSDGDDVTFSFSPVFAGDTGAQGDQGDQGDPFEPDYIVPVVDDLSIYEGEAVGTSVLVEYDATNDDKPTLYFLLDNATPEWSEGFDFVTTADASAISYDTSVVGLLTDATNVQDAIDTLAERTAGAALASQFLFNISTSAADPGTGQVGVDNAAMASATAIYINETTLDSVDVSSIFADLASCTASRKGTVRLIQQSDTTKWATFAVTAVTDNGAWQTFAVTYIGSSVSTFDSGESLYIQIVRATDGTGAVGKHTVGAAAGGIFPATTSGCADLAQAETSSNKINYKYLAFDASAVEYGWLWIPTPKSYNASTISMRAVWTHPATTTNFGVVWQFEVLALSDDDAIDTALGTAVTVTDTGGTTSDFYRSSESGAITPGNTAAKGDWLAVRVSRKADHASDTLAVDAHLVGVEIFYTTDTDTDA